MKVTKHTQKPTGSQIKRICMCMVIYREIDKRVNMHINSHVRHKELCLCCFLTVSGPIKAILTF